MFGVTAGTGTVLAGYQPFDRVTSVRFVLTDVNLRAVKDMGEIAVFIFYILEELSCQLRVPAALPTVKYTPVGLAVERWLHGS